jgi:GNAT superfamily N-acetyltransferase
MSLSVHDESQYPTRRQRIDPLLKPGARSPRMKMSDRLETALMEDIGRTQVDVVMDPVSHLPQEALAPLVAESELDGWRFVRRLADEWTSGANRFDKPAEALFIASLDGAIVGVCGLNVDPYAGDESVGRVRRLYVLRAYRGRGIGRGLVQAVVSAAAIGRFRMLRVRTESPEAGRFYDRLGFHQVAGIADCTHALDLVGAFQRT